MDSTAGTPRAARLLLAALAVALVAYVGYLVLHDGPEGPSWDRLYNCIEFGGAAACLLRAIKVPEERTAWLVLSLGMGSFAIGDVYWMLQLQDADHIPVPSPADVGYLGFYPAAYTALVLLIRARADRFTPGLWLEGLIGSFAVAALGAALLQQPIVEATGGSATTVATSLAYPLADTLLLSLVVGVLGLNRRRQSGTWFAVAAALAVFAVTDAIYGYQTSGDTYQAGTLLDAGWPVAFALLGSAAWIPSYRVATSRLQGWQSIVLPAAFGLAGLGVLIYAALGNGVYAIAVLLAAVSLVAVIARMGLMVSQRLRTVGALGVSEERYRHLVGGLPDTVIALFDRDLRLTLAEGAGLARPLEPGTALADVLPAERLGEVEAHYREALAGTPRAFELAAGPGGRTWYVELQPYRPDGEFIDGVFSVARDITDRKTTEEQLEHQALHDALTGLANRVLFLDRLEQALGRLSRHRSPLALLFVDLDRFKVVNDSLGHDAGDQVLVQAADRLRGTLRPIDTIARFGGDEFVILCEDAGLRAEVEEIAHRVGKALARPFHVAGQDMVLTASIGIVVCADPDAEAGALLRDADTAMYRAKDRGRATSEFFDTSMRMRAVQRLELESALRRAIETDQLRVLYQPQIRLVDGQTVACEALVRWAHPDLGLIDAQDFIPIAEESGLIVALGDWVLRRVCDDKVRWGVPMPVSVNVSPRQLADPDFVDNVADVLRETGVEPSTICLEVTESALFADPDTALLRLGALRELGLRLAIDDFGIGFSSLYHLRRLPDVDILKIDRAFIEELGHNRTDSAIVGAVIVLAGSLGMEIVAEGIESAEQAEELRVMGADYGQGYWFGRPRELRKVSELVASPE
jgi:diguanylate cyclase (GGDEF)-like protein